MHIAYAISRIIPAFHMIEWVDHLIYETIFILHMHISLQIIEKYVKII